MLRIALLLLFAVPVVASEPNVVLIVIDDLRPEYQSVGGPVEAPNLDALAERGVIFRNHFANVPVCGASRASMMSSLKPTSTRFLSFDSRLDADAPGAVSLPAHFKAHGWHTVANGKLFDIIADSEESWSEPVWNPAAIWASPVPSAGRGEDLQKAYLLGSPGDQQGAYERLAVPDTAYPDGRIALKSVADIKRLAMLDRPFFLAVGFRKPHLPFNAPSRYWQEADGIELPSTWRTPDAVPRIARHGWPELRYQYLGMPETGPVDEETARTLIAAYHASVRYIDAQVGHLMAAIDEAGLTDNTIVVVTGDHGWFLGEYQMWTKHALLDEGLRTPLTIAAPGIEAGQSDALSDLLDLLPTLADLAGLTIEAEWAGSSLVPALKDKTHPGKTISVARWLNGESLRTRNDRYTIWFDDTGEVLHEMLESGTKPEDLESLMLERRRALDGYREGEIALPIYDEIVPRWEALKTRSGL